MRVVNDRILRLWREVRGEVRDRAAEAARRAKALQDKLDRLDDAFLFANSIDQSTYERQRDKVRQDLALAQIDRHAEQLEEFDVEAFWRSLSAFCRGRRTCGCSPRSIKSSACSGCFSRRASRSTGFDSIEPP